MDTLTLLLDDIRQRGAEFLLIEAAEPWAVTLNHTGHSVFHVIVSGSAWLHRENEPPLALSGGDLLMLPRGEPHQLQSMSEKSSVVHDVSPDVRNPAIGNRKLPGASGGQATYVMSGYFHFDSGLAKPLIYALPTVVYLPGDNGKMRKWLQLGVDFIADEISEHKPAQQAIMNRIADAFFIEIVRDYLETVPVGGGQSLPDNKGGGSWLLALRDPVLSTALSAIHSKPERDWTVTKLAERAHVSRSAFAERFRKVMGVTPLAYMTAHRMRLACWQLAHTKLPIISIAEAVGYGSDTAFSQAFKRERGCTPSEFRRQSMSDAASDDD